MTPEQDNAIPADAFSVEAMTSGPTLETFRRVDDPASGSHWYEWKGKRIASVSELVESYGHSRAMNDFAQGVADQGTRRHKWIELDMKGLLDMYDPPESPSTKRTIAQARAAREYLGVKRAVHIEHSDFAAVHTPCGLYRFGGTCDTIAELEDGSLALLDWKGRARSRVYRIKLALYKKIWPVQHKLAIHLDDESDTWTPGGKTDGAPNIEVYNEPQDDAEAMRIIESAAYRDMRISRKWWTRPLTGPDPDMSRVPF